MLTDPKTTTLSPQNMPQEPQAPHTMLLRAIPSPPNFWPGLGSAPQGGGRKGSPLLGLQDPGLCFGAETLNLRAIGQLWENWINARSGVKQG